MIARVAAATSAAAAMIALLVWSALSSRGNFALTSFLVIVLALVPFYLSFEHSKPQARQLVPIAVLAAVAALGRMIFAPLPNVKPVSAVVIVSGAVFGPQAGFMTGATAALASNLFFGQGPFTPWQMFAWGLMGFTAGLCARFFKKPPVVCAFGFVWGFLFGWIMDCYQVLAFVSPLKLSGVLLTFAASFYFDLTHAISNVAFLLCIFGPWVKILTRVKIKYGLVSGDTAAPPAAGQKKRRLRRE